MLDWTPYDAHHWAKCRQRQMRPEEKLKFEKMAAAMLGLNPASAVECWGRVAPPGRNAAVIHVFSNIPNRYTLGKEPFGLKIFNLVDGETMRRKIIRFHSEQRTAFAGLPHPLVQEVLAWGSLVHEKSRERWYLVQQWNEGVVLEEMLKEMVSREDALRILDDLFLELLIPLWGKGTSWWDVRESNYVFTPARRLTMIDSDTVGGYADEIVNTPQVYKRRNHGTDLAMVRYSTWLVSMVRAHAGRGSKGKVEKQVRALMRHYLVPRFVRPYPLAPDWAERARDSFNAFRSQYSKFLN